MTNIYLNINIIECEMHLLMRDKKMLRISNWESKEEDGFKLDIVMIV